MRATAFCPASIGNVAVGFDVLGHALVGPGDRATVTRTGDGTVRVAAIRGVVETLPMGAEENTAGRALLALTKRIPQGIGFEVEIDKGIALGSGMGGSAASAVAALVAANATLDSPVDLAALYECAIEGEASCSRRGRRGRLWPARTSSPTSSCRARGWRSSSLAAGVATRPSFGGASATCWWSRGEPRSSPASPG